ncbi:MAG TPA: hypothetical protein VHT52_22600 [Stellaceae bacterium]|jgi:hypothetical protein|nr:hypothetical protein [Stellaceae bacterium]
MASQIDGLAYQMAELFMKKFGYYVNQRATDLETLSDAIADAIEKWLEEKSKEPRD